MVKEKKRSASEIVILILRIVFVLGGGGLIATAAYLFKTTNGNFGNWMTLFLGLFLVLVGFFINWLRIAFRKWRCVRLLIYFFLIVGVAFLGVISFLVFKGNVATTTHDEEAIIILGAAVYGERVSPTLKVRLDQGFENYMENKEALIVVSGGQGADEDVSEALAMKRYLVEKGVPEEKIIEEGHSTNTYENFTFSKKLLDDIFGEREYRVTYVTNDFHTYRAGEMARRVGLEATVDPSSTRQDQLIPSYLRESLAVIAMWFGR